jgi:hypothetical protein
VTRRTLKFEMQAYYEWYKEIVKITVRPAHTLQPRHGAAPKIFRRLDAKSGPAC